MSSIESNDNKMQQLETLKRNFADKIPDYIQQIIDVWNGLSYVNWSDNTVSSLQFFCHRLAGSTGTYGFNDICDIVTKIDIQLKEIQELPENLCHEKIDSINELVLALNKISINADNSTAIIDSDHPVKLEIEDKLVFIVDDDVDTAKWLATILEQQKVECLFFNTIESALVHLRKRSPDVIILDINFPKGRLAGIEAISQFRDELGYRVPVILTSARHDLKIRLEATNHGCNGFLSKPIDIDKMKETLNSILDIPDFVDQRVLIIDDDKSTALYYASILKNMGIDTQHIQNPLESLKAISEFQPHLILLDNLMPGCTGLELATVLRQDPSLMSTGIIFITADEDFSLADKALGLGANGFLHKPASIEDLKTNVRKYLINSRKLSHKIRLISHINPENNLHTQEHFFQQCEFQSSQASKSQKGLLLIALSNYVNLSKIHGLGKSSLMIHRLAKYLSTLLDNDDYSTQFGESQFLLYFEQDNMAQLLNKADHIANQLSQYLESHQLDYSGCEFTFCLTPLDQQSHNIEQAISLCHEQQDVFDKVEGHVVVSRVHKTESDSNALEARLQSDIIEAIEDKSYFLVYQPIFIIDSDASDRKSFDAFVRLRNKEHATFEPIAFFQFLTDEDTASMDRVVINKIIDQLHSINKSPKNEIFLHAKLSESAIQNRDTLLWISNSLRARRMLNPSTLVFEFSEKVLIENLTSARYFCEKIRLLGCSLSISGFGEQNSALDLINELKPDVVKVKSEFLKSGQDKNMSKKINLLFSYAEENNIEIIASHVENAAMLGPLYEHGLRKFQGYFITHPMENIDLDFISETELF